MARPSPARMRMNVDVFLDTNILVWSEDLNTGQDYGGVCVVNPLHGL